MNQDPAPLCKIKIELEAPAEFCMALMELLRIASAAAKAKEEQDRQEKEQTDRALDAVNKKWLAGGPEGVTHLRPHKSGMQAKPTTTQ